MPVKCRLLLMLALLVWWTAGPTAAESPSEPRAGTLAGSVPADARLFLQLRSTHLLGFPASGSAVGRLLKKLVPTTRPAPETQPAGVWVGWQELFTNAVGLDNRKAADLLFAGPLALAADGWSGLGDAILLAEPKDPAALEAELESRRDPASAGQQVRRYRLAQDHELACDGRMVAVGRSTNRSGIYPRTIALWESEDGISLGDLGEFRERMCGLPAGAQLILYAGTNSRASAAGPIMGAWWPEAWPRLRSAAAGVVVTASGITVETNGRLETEGQAAQSSDSLTRSLSRLPASAVVAWTQRIDFVEAFRRLDAAYPEGALRFLHPAPPGEEIEDRLLRHLVGDSIFMIGRAASRPTGAESDLLLPVLALAVETDDPRTVESMMERLAGNFLESLDLESFPDGELPVEYKPLGPSGGGILSIAVGRLLWSQSGCPLFRSLEISWTVADRWLVIGTHAGAVREIVRARRGEVPVLSVDAIPEVMRHASPNAVAGEMLLVARPKAMSEMIDSWIGYVSRHHGEMLQPAWWHRLRQKQRLASVQLGVWPADRVLRGEVEVGQTLPNYPAHGPLKPGDRIQAVDGQALDPEHPLQSLREKLAMRERADGVTLRVLRDGREQDIEIPMPTAGWDTVSVQPLDLLRQAADLLRIFSSATYAVWRPSPEEIKARLEVRFAPGPPAS